MSDARRSCPKCGATFPSHTVYCGIDGTKLLPDETDPLIGRTIDRYKIAERIGDGGMARLYRAVHTYLEQDVAVKVLFGELASDEAFTRRFRREALAASRVKHPNVVQIMDFGVTPEKLPFLVMELVSGETLSAYLRRKPNRSLRWVATIASQIAAGLAEAHKSGFVHRDLKPSNVMITGAARDSAKILDFGLVHFAPGTGSGGSGSISITRTGQILGTPTYMAPEQISGEKVSPAVDLYALGVILYEMIAGRPPFTGEMAMVLTQHVATPPAPPPPSGGLELVALALLEKDPKRRPASAEDVAARLEAITGSSPEIQALPLSTPPVQAEAVRPLVEALEAAPTGPSGEVHASAVFDPPSRKWPLFAAIGVAVAGLAGAAGLWAAGFIGGTQVEIVPIDDPTPAPPPPIFVQRPPAPPAAPEPEESASFVGPPKPKKERRGTPRTGSGAEAGSAGTKPVAETADTRSAPKPDQDHSAAADSKPAPSPGTDAGGDLAAVNPAESPGSGEMDVKPAPGAASGAAGDGAAGDPAAAGSGPAAPDPTPAPSPDPPAGAGAVDQTPPSSAEPPQNPPAEPKPEAPQTTVSETPPPGQPDSAKKAADSARELAKLKERLEQSKHSPKDTAAAFTAADKHKRRAIEAMVRKDYATADIALAECLTALPTHAPCQKLYGELHERRGNLKAAAEAYKKYLKLDPDAPDTAAILSKIDRLER